VLPWRAPKLVVGHSCVLSWYWGVRRETAPACCPVFGGCLALLAQNGR
jgi:hypothetical protein